MHADVVEGDDGRRIELHEDVPAPREVLVEHLLDRVADLVGQLEYQHPVLPGAFVVLIRPDGLAEPDDPLGRQRDEAEWPEPWEEGSDREIGEAADRREHLRVVDHRVDLLGPNDGHGNDWNPCLQSQLHEPASSEPLELVAVLVPLAHSLVSLREYPDELASGQQAQGILVAGQRVPNLPGERSHNGKSEGEVCGQQPEVPVGRVLVKEPELHHYCIDRDGPGVVPHQEGSAGRWNVLQPQPVRAPVILVKRLYQGQDELFGELGIESEFVHLVVAEEAPPGQLEQLSQTLGREWPDTLRRGWRLVHPAEAIGSGSVPTSSAGRRDRLASVGMPLGSLDGDDPSHHALLPRGPPVRSARLRLRNSYTSCSHRSALSGVNRRRNFCPVTNSSRACRVENLGDSPNSRFRRSLSAIRPNIRNWS